MVVLQGVGKIAVFYAPEIQQWVIRQWYSATNLYAGQTYWDKDSEPTDAELQAHWGDDIQIMRGKNLI